MGAQPSCDSSFCREGVRCFVGTTLESEKSKKFEIKKLFLELTSAFVCCTISKETQPQFLNGSKNDTESVC